MNRLARSLVALGIACAGLMATVASMSAAAADDAVVTADKAVQAALAKGDKVAANKWLDPDFSWIDAEGIMWAREDAFRGGLKPLIPAGDDVKITEHKYGKSVVWIQWNEGSKYSARFWVKRPAGWKLLHTTEIASVPKRDFQTVEPTYDIPCNNPCKAVPYKPLSAGERLLWTSGKRRNPARQIGKCTSPIIWISASSARTAGLLPRRLTESLE